MATIYLIVQIISSEESFIQYVRKIFRKTNISYPLICPRTCSIRGKEMLFFGKKFPYVLNEFLLKNKLAQNFIGCRPEFSLITQKKMFNLFPFVKNKTTTQQLLTFPAGNYLFKVNEGNTRIICEISSKLTLTTPTRRQ